MESIYDFVVFNSGYKIKALLSQRVTNYCDNHQWYSKMRAYIYSLSNFVTCIQC